VTVRWTACWKCWPTSNCSKYSSGMGIPRWRLLVS